MLKAEEIQYVFNEPALEVGDILLMNTYHERQRERMKGCVYDHVAIYAGDAFIMEADGLGVSQSHIYSYGFKMPEHACFLSLKDVTQRQREAIVMRAREEMGKAYGIREAYAVVEYKDKGNQDALANTTFCSRLVAVAYNSQGFRIAVNPYYCAPDDFLSCDLLQKVEPALMPATAEVIATVLQTQDQRENPDTVLQEAFELFSTFYGRSIQTIADLSLAALAAPDKDEEAIRLLNEQTRMFRASDETKSSWPWFDDDVAFKVHFRTVEDRLFFLNNQFLHFDKTYLPLFARNGITASALCIYYPHSKMLARLKDGFNDVYQEAVRIRKRLEDLYLMTFTEEKKSFRDFVEKYGLYQNYEYREVVTDISFILESAMKFGFPSQTV